VLLLYALLACSVADQINGQPTPELDGLSPNRSAGFHPGQVEDF